MQHAQSCLQAAFWWRLQPGEARESMHIIDACFHLPAHARKLRVSMLLTKTLLYVHEYPPDAHRGFDIAGTRVVSAVEGWSASAQRCSAMLEASWLQGLV